MIYILLPDIQYHIDESLIGIRDPLDRAAVLRVAAAYLDLPAERFRGFVVDPGPDGAFLVRPGCLDPEGAAGDSYPLFWSRATAFGPS